MHTTHCTCEVVIGFDEGCSGPVVGPPCLLCPCPPAWVTFRLRPGPCRDRVWAVGYGKVTSRHHRHVGALQQKQRSVTPKYSSTCGFWHGFSEILDMTSNRGKSYIPDESGITPRAVRGLFRCWGGRMVACLSSLSTAKQCWPHVLNVIPSQIVCFDLVRPSWCCRAPDGHGH